MADENLKDFAINWIVVGLLFFCMIGFAMHFMLNNNNSYGFNEDTNTKFSDSYTGINNKLEQVPEQSDTVLNITSETDPEASDLGSRDSVSSAFETVETGRGMFRSMKTFFGWIFSEDISQNTPAQLLLTVFGGIIGFIAVYLGYKYIKTGT